VNLSPRLFGEKGRSGASREKEDGRKERERMALVAPPARVYILHEGQEKRHGRGWSGKRKVRGNVEWKEIK